MKYSELKRKLKAHGGYFVAHCGKHDKWMINGTPVYIPRHDAQEVRKGTLQSILTKACIKL